MKYTDIDDADVTSYADVVAYELATAIKNNILFLSKVIPVGQVTPIMTGIPGVPTPDVNVWQECDGSEITNPNSPMRSKNGITTYTPDMTDRYVKVASGFGESGDEGGSNTANFAHSHGGNTGQAQMDPDGDSDNDLFNTKEFHSHTISSNLSNGVNMEPPFYTVKFFMKIQ